MVKPCQLKSLFATKIKIMVVVLVQLVQIICHIMGIIGGHFNLVDFICVAKLKSHHLISVQHDLVKIFYVMRKAYQFQLFIYKE